MKIGIIVGSIREGRKGEAVGQWVAEQAQGRDATYELLDLKSFDVPLLTSPTHPMQAKKSYDDERVQAWSDAVDACDGYVFVTPEYNHGVPRLQQPTQKPDTPGANRKAPTRLPLEWRAF